MGVEKRVANSANAQSEAQQKQGRKKKHHQRKTKCINSESRKPKGINLREGESRGGMAPPPRTNH